MSGTSSVRTTVCHSGALTKFAKKELLALQDLDPDHTRHAVWASLTQKPEHWMYDLQIPTRRVCHTINSHSAFALAIGGRDDIRVLVGFLAKGSRT